MSILYFVNSSALVRRDLSDSRPGHGVADVHLSNNANLVFESRDGAHRFEIASGPGSGAEVEIQCPGGPSS